MQRIPKLAEDLEKVYMSPVCPAMGSNQDVKGREERRREEEMEGEECVS